MDGWMDGTLVAVPVLLLRGAWTFLSYVPVFLCPFDSTSIGEEVRLDIDGLLLTRPPYHGVPHLLHLYVYCTKSPHTPMFLPLLSSAGGPFNRCGVPRGAAGQGADDRGRGRAEGARSHDGLTVLLT